MSNLNTPGLTDAAAETPSADSLYSGETVTTDPGSTPRPPRPLDLNNRVQLPNENKVRYFPVNYVYNETYVDQDDGMELVMREAQAVTDGSQSKPPYIQVLAADKMGHKFPGQQEAGFRIEQHIDGTGNWKTEEEKSKGDRITLVFYRRQGKKPYSYVWFGRRKPIKADL